MIDFVNAVKSLLKIEQIYTDNNIFKLHYKFTVILLIVFSILLTSKQYFGEPITCNVGSDQAKMKEIIDVFCWIHGTFIVRNSLSNPILPGISNEHYKVKDYENSARQLSRSVFATASTEIVWHKYYQWVCIIFCFQALLFYIPRYVWKTWEGGRIRLLVDDLKGPLVTPSWNTESRMNLVRYLMSGRNSHTLYACRYTLCEVLNLANVILQILFMDWFLEGKFSVYGILVNGGDKWMAMNYVFPKLTKCHYYNFGPSGEQQLIDALCILPLNILNEKLFLILWFWLYILIVLSIVGLLYRLLVVCSPSFRIYLLLGHSRYIGKNEATAVIKEISYGDFFVLHNIGSNVNPLIFNELIDGICEYMKINRKVYKAHHVVDI